MTKFNVTVRDFDPEKDLPKKPSPTPELDLEERAIVYIKYEFGYDNGYEITKASKKAYKTGYTDCAQQKQQEFVALVEGEIKELEIYKSKARTDEAKAEYEYGIFLLTKLLTIIKL